jgi:hypothetical protein
MMGRVRVATKQKQRMTLPAKKVREGVGVVMMTAPGTLMTLLRRTTTLVNKKKKSTATRDPHVSVNHM